MEESNLRERVEQIDDANFPMSGAEVQSYLQGEGVEPITGTTFFEVIPAERQYMSKEELLLDIEGAPVTDSQQASMDDNLAA